METKIRKAIQAIEKRVAKELQDGEYQENRQKDVYAKLRKLLSDSEYYDFLNTIDWGFGGLDLDPQARVEKDWIKEVAELKKEIKAVLRKNRRLGEPIKIEVNPSLDLFIWNVELSMGRPEKEFKRMLVNKMISLLIDKTSQQQVAYIISDVFLYFYNIDRGIDGLKRKDIPDFKRAKELRL